MLIKDFMYPTLLKYFEEISAIPRASFEEEKIADYLVSFAESRGLEYYRDGAHNVLINMPASSGYEGRECVLLQGHTDMVCEKNIGSGHDFSKDGIDLYAEDGKIRARGTTLGADNGVAVAVMLALLDGAAEVHPPLQCLFTTAEEVGMVGAVKFDYSKIYSKYMLNLDSADDREIIAGCAGGVRTTLTYDVKRETVSGKKFFEIKLGGLAGGHSGEDVNLGRANANKLLAIILAALAREEKLGLRLVSFAGGTADNAIPREARAVVCADNAEALSKILANTEKMLKAPLAEDDKDFHIELTQLDMTEAEAIDRQTAENFIFTLQSAAVGVFAYNQDMRDIVEFSRNIGIVRTHGDKIEMVFNTRSSMDERMDMSCMEIEAYARMFGGRAEHFNRYSGWLYVPKSLLREKYIKASESAVGITPKVTVIHAGLECSVISRAVKGIDIISCGPVVRNLHSPDEYLDVKSFERFFSTILEFLKQW